MKIIILGAGQVGRTAAYHLSREEANDVIDLLVKLQSLNFARQFVDQRHESL